MMNIESWLIYQFPVYCLIAIGTHLIVSFSQTYMHYKLGHHPRGRRLFSNHINFHHTNYAKDHLVSKVYLDDEGNNTPLFLIPAFAVATFTYFILPVDLFLVHVIVSAASFYAHVYFDNEYHVEGSWLLRYEWFRRKQALHFVHHRHANTNFAVIHFFWDRVLGTYRKSSSSPTARKD